MSKLPSPPPLKRSTQKYSAKVEIVIACEGKVTEPHYFEECIRHYGAGMVKLRVLSTTGVPITVVRAAVEEKSRLQTQARRTDPSQRIPFSVWAVFDRDEHNIMPAFALAQQHKIGLAFSNPCFELWPLLHLHPAYGSQQGRHLVQKDLHSLMPSYHHQTNARVDFQAIAGKVQAALKSALTLNSSRLAEDCINGCPSTTVGELVKKIIDNGRVNFRDN